MIIFLYGEDSYRSLQKLNEIIGRYKQSGRNQLNLVSFDAQSQDFEELYENCKAASMFSEKKLIVVKNLSAGKQVQEGFLEHFETLGKLEDVIVIHESGAVDERLKLFKKLIKECKCQEFKFLEGIRLRQWVQQEFERRKTKANLDAVDLLVQYAGKDSWRLSSEVKKLSDYKNYETVRKEDVKLQVAPLIEVEIFKTIDALAQKNKRQAFHFLQKHLESGDNALYLLSMVAYQFRNLLVVKELAQKGLMYASIVKKSGLHPFVVKKTYFMCSQFSFEELQRIYRAIFKADADIKTGKVEAEAALDALVASI